jgi:hypothetical protein
MHSMNLDVTSLKRSDIFRNEKVQNLQSFKERFGNATNTLLLGADPTDPLDMRVISGMFLIRLCL